MPKSCTVHRSISLVRSSNEATWRRVLTFQVPILNSSRSWLSFPVVFPSALWWASSQDKGRDRVGCPLLSPPGPEVPPWYARLVAAPFLIVVIMKWICCNFLQGQKSTIGVGALILPHIYIVAYFILELRTWLSNSQSDLYSSTCATLIIRRVHKFGCDANENFGYTMSWDSGTSWACT